RMREPAASLIGGGQLFQLRWDQGRLEELEAPVGRAVQLYPLVLSLRCNLAFLYAETGREDESRKIFDELAVDGFGELVGQGGATISVCWLAEACALLEDAPRAATLYELLLPYARQVHVIAGSANSCAGS